MINGQLELSFTGAHEQHPWTRRQRHLSRARWWFERMRQVVDRAIDWPPAPAPRPEQTWFAEASRQAVAAQGSNDQERQICE